MRLIFAGTPAFAERALAALHGAGHDIALVLTQPDRSAGRGLHHTLSPVKRLATHLGAPVYQPETLRHEDALARLRDARADAMVVAAYGMLLPEGALNSTRGGGVNIHASLLPRWRGAAPIQRAILAGDRETGVSIMQMDVGLDTGPVLARASIPIAAEDDSGTLHDKLAELGARMIVDTMADLDAACARGVPQTAEGATYARKIEKREARLDWSRGATELERVVRAFRPAPGAAAVLGKHAVKIWAARAAEGRGEPGKVLSATPRGILVACGDAALEISELQREGARRLPAGEFLRGQRLAPGDRFE